MSKKELPEPTPAQLRGEEPMPGSAWEAGENMRKELRNLAQIILVETWSTPQRKRRLLLTLFVVWLVVSVAGTLLGL